MNITYQNARIIIDGLMLPWFNELALKELLKIKTKDWRVFEWGSGQSTLWWQRNAKNVISVEHNKTYYNIIKKGLLSNCILLYRKMVRGKNCEYTNVINRTKGRFDCIIIDGRNRVLCINQIKDKVKPGGLIILDNSERARYQKGIDILNEKYTMIYKTPIDKTIPSQKWETTFWMNNK